MRGQTHRACLFIGGICCALLCALFEITCFLEAQRCIEHMADAPQNDRASDRLFARALGPSRHDYYRNANG